MLTAPARSPVTDFESALVLIQTETAVKRSYRNRSAEIMQTATDLKQTLVLKRDCDWDISETAVEIHMEGCGSFCSEYPIRISLLGAHNPVL
jgi:hypothetical protein